MSDPASNSDVSNAQVAPLGLLQQYASLLSLIADGQLLRDAKAAYLTATPEGNLAAMGLFAGFEGPPYAVLDKCFFPWLVTKLILEPAENCDDPAVRAAAKTLREAYCSAHASQRAHLSLVKR